MTGIGENLRVCFVTNAQYQLMLADTYARYIYDTYGIRPLVLCRTFEGFDFAKLDTADKYIIEPYVMNDRSTLGRILFSLKCGHLYRFMPWKKMIENNKVLLFVFNDRNKLQSRMINEVKKQNPNSIVVLVEEGNSTYSAEQVVKSELIYNLEHYGAKILLGSGRDSRVIGDNKNIDAVIVRDTNRYSALDKAKNKEVLQQDTKIMSHCEKFLRNYADASGKMQKCDVLFLGQPFYRNGRFYKPEYEVLCEIFESISQDAKVLIKPHPRDDYAKYERIVEKYGNVRVVSRELSTFPMEALMSLIDAKVVMTIESSAITTISDLFPNVDAYVLRKLPMVSKFETTLRATGERMPQIDDDMFTAKYGNIYEPENLIEFTKMVSASLLNDRISASNEVVETDKLKRIEFKEIDILFEGMSEAL